MKILKIISRVDYFCTMSPGRAKTRDVGGESFEEKPELSLQHRMFVYLTATDLIAPDCLA